MRPLVAGLTLCALAAGARPAVSAAAADPLFERAAVNGVRSEEVFRQTRRMMHAWLAHADQRTLLLPDIPPGGEARPPDPGPLHAAQLRGRQLSLPGGHRVLHGPPAVRGPDAGDAAQRRPVHHTANGLPGNLDLKTGGLGPPSLFGAAEYAKDGLLAVTELLGRTPWFFRMADLTATLMERAPVATAYGPLPDTGAELNGDVLQVLVRLATMTGDRRYLEWAQRIGDAYVEEVLPRNHGLPGYTWDFAAQEGPDRMRLRDHGNEIVVGLTLLHALETRPRGPAGRRLARPHLPDAGPDPGLREPGRDPLRRDPRVRPHAHRQTSLSDNWGYVYGAVYTHYMVTGEARYREAVLRVLRRPAQVPRLRLGARQPRRLRRFAGERPLPRRPRARPRSHRLDRIGGRARCWPSSSPTAPSSGGTAMGTGRARCSSTRSGRPRAATWTAGGTASSWARRGTGSAWPSRWRARGLAGDGCISTTRGTARQLNFAAELRPAQRVAGVVHGGREPALPGGGPGGPGRDAPGIGAEGGDRSEWLAPLRGGRSALEGAESAQNVGFGPARYFSRAWRARVTLRSNSLMYKRLYTRPNSP